jgi:hypothetical protein
MITRMLSVNAVDRPTAEELVDYFRERNCRKSGFVQLEAMENDP